MRKFAVALGALAVLFAGTANASYTIDLIWADTGTPTLTISPGDPTAVAGTNECQDGALSAAGVGRCLLVRFTAAAGFTGVITTLGWNAVGSGVTVEHAGNWSFGKFGSGPPGLAPAGPKVAGTADCAVDGCTSAYGSFGGLSTSPVPLGAYTIGSINFDTSGALVGSHTILNFARTGVDGVTNKTFGTAIYQMNDAILNVIPEPGTASLLGLGIMGLVLAGRRRKA